MKKLFLLLFIMLLPLMAKADDSGTCGDKATWSFTESNQTLSISGTGNTEDYEVGTAPWYNYRNEIKNVIIGSGITHVGNFSFYDCANLTFVKISTDVVRIGCYAFGNCSSLLTIDIPKNVISIGNDAFINTAWYNSQASGLVYAGYVVYGYKGSVPANLEIKTGTVGIAENAFASSNEIKSVKIPNSVRIIGLSAFQNCEYIETISIGNGVEEIGDYAFYDCSALSSVVIPDKTVLLGNNSFRYCIGLNSVVIPSSVTTIGYGAFDDCTSLTSVFVRHEEPEYFGYVFSNRENATLYVPYGCKNAYATAQYWKEFKNIAEEDTEIEFKDTEVRNICITNWDTNNDGKLEMSEAAAVSSLGYVFSNNNEIVTFDELKFFTGLTSLYSSAFSNCTELEKITLPEKLTSIGSNAFSGCSSLTSVTLPSSLVSIGVYAFQSCSLLSSLEIPNGVTDIGAGAFQGCSLTSISIPDGVTSIDNELFRQCWYLETVTIPNSVKKIYYNAFYGCGSLGTIDIPNSVTTIDNNAFEYSGLTSVTIGDGVTKIGAYAFKDCTKLTDVTCMSEAIPSTNSDAFKNTAIGKATLHVPGASIAAYCAAEPWKNFQSIVAIDGTEVQKCATPTITVKEGKLTFSCETEGVKYVTDASFSKGSFAANDNEMILAGTTTCHVTVYATKEGYLNSDEASVDVELNVGGSGCDVDGNGSVTITDAVKVVNKILENE